MGLTDPVCGMIMGSTAEVLAKEFGVTREEQDAFALESHLRALRGKTLLREEIVPVIPPPKYKSAIEHDNGPREGQTLEALAKLKPYFDRRSGTVTVGNSSQVTDGAAALLVMSEKKGQGIEFENRSALSVLTPSSVLNRTGWGLARRTPSRKS